MLCIWRSTAAAEHLQFSSHGFTSHAGARELLAGTWLPGRYVEIEVFVQKHRLVSAAPFRDRVLHHALCPPSSRSSSAASSLFGFLARPRLIAQPGHTAYRKPTIPGPWPEWIVDRIRYIEADRYLPSPRIRVLRGILAGALVPVETVIRLALRQGAKVLIDGCQAAPRLPVDVQALGCSRLRGSARERKSGSQQTRR